MIGPLGRSHRLRPLVGRVLDAAIPAAGRAGFSASAGLCVEVLGAAAAHPRLVGAHRVVGRKGDAMIMRMMRLLRRW